MKLPLDKMLHASISFVILELIYSATRDISVSVALTLMVGLIKELNDKSNSFDEHINDMLANFAGIGLYVLQLFIFELLWSLKA